MTTSLLSQLGIIPAILIALTGILILRGVDREKATRRFLLFLLGVGVLLQLALFITKRSTGPDNQLPVQVTWLFAPSFLGILVLILLNGRTVLAGMNRRSNAIAGLLGLIMVILFGLNWDPQWGMEYLVLQGALILVIGWVLASRYGWLVSALGLLSLVGLFLNNWLMSHPPDYTSGSPSLIFGIVYLFGINLWPFLAVVLSAKLMSTSFKHTNEQDDNVGPRRSRLVLLFELGLASILLFYLAYTVFWGSVWDHTDDGLFGVMISSLAGLIAIGAGMVMMVTLKGKFRLAGLFFAILVPMMLFQSFNAGWRVSYHGITERRAESIARALERFHAREGYYPDSLEALMPRDLLLIQQPVILAGEEWCYESGGGYYQLAAFYREFFSAPVSLRLYESAGEAPTSPMPCEERLAAMKEKYYSPMDDPSAMRPPVPTSQPENEVGMPKVEILPLLDGATAMPGSWSPDSSYFAFATQTDILSLHFLNGRTGEICTSDEQFSMGDTLRGHLAWLPDDRLLYLDSSGRMAALTPCQLGSEQLDDRFPVSFKQIASVAQRGDRLLLQSEHAYWILNERTLTAIPIPDVTPVPYELHWDNFSWLPDGDVLAISRLNGRQGSNAGSTLYMVDGSTGEILKSAVLNGEFGQSAPWIEVLSDHELLMNGDGEWLLMDFNTNPPTSTNVLADIFEVDVKFPDEISASGSFVNPSGDGYFLAVRLNHPRNQATYLHDSLNGQVRVYDHEYHTLLVFPNGYLMEMPKQELVPTYRDEYDIVLVGQPETVHPRLKLEGHTPREYPHLSLVYIEKTSQLAVASEQGVSLVSLPSGKMEAYWELIGEGYSPWLVAAPNGSSMIAAKDFGGLYYIPMSSGQ